MIKDGRDGERIKRALAARGIYENLDAPIIDTTNLTVEKTADRVIEMVTSM